MKELKVVENKFAGEKYVLHNGNHVTYVGFLPKDGHFVYNTCQEGSEWIDAYILPHNTKFYYLESNA